MKTGGARHSVRAVVVKQDASVSTAAGRGLSRPTNSGIAQPPASLRAAVVDTGRRVKYNASMTTVIWREVRDNSCQALMAQSFANLKWSFQQDDNL